MSRAQLRCLVDAEARKHSRISGKEALRRIRRGRTGIGYLWSDLTLLAELLR